MVNIEFHLFPDGRLRLEARGHAGCGVKGNDIVCAAVSILMLTAAREAERMYEKGFLLDVPETVLREGYASVTVRPCPQYRQQVRTSFTTVFTGLRLLARQYPNAVRVKGKV